MPYMTCLVHILEGWFGVEQLEDYLNFANYLLWVFTPLILLILPYFTIFLLYLTIIFLHIYKRKNVLREAYSHNLWDGARKTVATLWDGHAAVWHGYEVHGMEKIPEEGPALIIFYHGAIPIDFYYFMAKIFIHKGRTCRVVADHFVFKIPGFSLLLDVFCALHGPREKCVEILRSGHLLAISPGGVREALLSDETYNIVWGNRKGFAQVAIDAKVVSCIKLIMKGKLGRLLNKCLNSQSIEELRYFHCTTLKMTAYNSCNNREIVLCLGSHLHKRNPSGNLQISSKTLFYISKPSFS